MNNKNIFFVALIFSQVLALWAMDSSSDDNAEIFTRTLPRELHIRALSESFNLNLGYPHSNHSLHKKLDEIIINASHFSSEFLQLTVNN